MCEFSLCLKWGQGFKWQQGLVEVTSQTFQWRFHRKVQKLVTENKQMQLSTSLNPQAEFSKELFNEFHSLWSRL